MQLNNLTGFTYAALAGRSAMRMNRVSMKKPYRLNLAAILILLIAALLILSACSSEPPADTQLEAVASPTTAAVELDVCLSSTNMNRAGVDYAQKKGLFAKHGLDVNLIGVEGGPDATRALLSGQVDICQIAGPAVVNADLAGAELAIIAGIINRQLYSLMVGPEINSAADLKGKSLAVSEPGSSSDTILRFGLESLGLDPDNDVTILSIGGNSARVAAMEAGSVVGTMVSVPQSGLAKALGFSALLDPDDMNLPHQHTAVVVRKPFLEENRETVTSFIKALSEATFLMRQDREGTLDLMSGVLLLDPEQDSAILDEAYDVIILENMDERLGINRDGVQRLIDVARLENPNALDLSVDDIVDESILNSLEEAGFYDLLGEQ
jgi:NitT/TauT family transport system substrate-binding protein